MLVLKGELARVKVNQRSTSVRRSPLYSRVRRSCVYIVLCNIIRCRGVYVTCIDVIILFIDM